ncbi:MAG: GNAT family N-acetyltransferase [Maribacter sp.]|nr:GNAT family N-acetyltransferase [Maribacter sp.]
MIPTLKTERLKLIPPNADCFALYEQFYTDAEASKMYGGPISKEQVWARLKADLGSWHLVGFGIWIIQLKANNNFIGTCGFWKGNDWPRELTWWVLPEARGKGVATEASKAALLHAYNEFKWDTVETYMNDENIAARVLVKKLEGVKTKRLKFIDGLSRDIYVLPKPA